MLYNQKQRKNKDYVENDQPLLKDFFENLLNNKILNSQMADSSLRGFIETHTAEEIIDIR